MRKRRLLAGLLAAVMLVGLLPTVSFAAGEVDLSALRNIADRAALSHSPEVTGTWLPEIDDIHNLVNGDYSDQFRWIHGGVQDYITDQGVEPSVTLTFDHDYSVGGFKLGIFKNDDEGSHTYVYRILGKAEGETEYQELASGTASKASDNCVKTHALSALTALSEVRLVLTNESNNVWPILAELEVLAELPPEEDPYQGLMEVAALSEITVPNNEGEADRIIDGSVGTWWGSNNGSWPVNVDFALPGNLSVKRVEVDFERFNGRTFDLAVSRAVNNVTSDYQQLTSQNGHSANETFVYDMDEPQRMTHVRVSLLGTNGGAWPALAEVRIYAVDETIDLNEYDDITGYAAEASGSGYKQWDFGGNQQIVGFRAALPNGVTAVVKGKMKRGTEWTTHMTELTNGDNVFTFPKGMSAVRVELSDPSQLTSFQIYGTYTAPVTDSGSVAFEKPAHSNFNAATLYLVNDGDTSTGWRADMYPAYVDIDLEENYNISEIQVFTPAAGYTEYTLYTSMDGRDFDLVASKLNSNACAEGGDKFAVTKEARIVRVYLEYYSQSAQPILNEIRVIGTPSGTAVRTAPAVAVGNFEDTEYADPITETDVIDEVQGIISRQVGSSYVSWFTFALADQPNGYDYFTLTDEGGKIKVTGNNGVSLATGVNHYLKYFCNVHISQVGNQVNMPDAIVPVGTAVHKETRFPVRYAYNYCTHSYSMSFWNEAEWRSELDWLALNGVNVVLDITGQEEVWREFLMSVGYTHEEAKDFLAGPGYYAWAYMANLTGFGGPIHDSFLTERTELGRKNQRIMRTLGMEPVLQAFSGMVPVDIDTHDPDAQIIPQGVWCSFQRPTMLKTNTATYDEYAAKFYAAQKKVFGDAKYYATDPFHEGGTTGGMSTTTVASELLNSLLDFDSDAVWVIQSWQGNPSSGLLAGLRQGTDRRSHAIVLDLYAEKDENWKTYGEDTDGDGLKEFSDTPWVFCQLNNFGGRMGLHGHLDSLQKNIPAAANTTRHMAGIGISPEGSQENPVLYDFLFETIWVNNAAQPLAQIDVDQWLKDYVTRRYGAQSDSAEAAMAILAETVYKDSLNRTGQGAPESVINARPALSIGAASTWGNSSINYSKGRLEEAARLLLEDYDTLSQSDPYLYDLADVLKQILSNTAQNLHSKMAAAYTAKNAAEFSDLSDQFLALIDLAEQVMGTRTEFTFGKWTGGAVKMAENADDFTQRLYLRNAKALVTTWGSIQQCNAGGLKDYSNRQWAGLTNDYYKTRWVRWIDQAKVNLSNNSNAAISIDWFPWEWSYARDPKLYSSASNGLDIKELGEQILRDHSVRDPLGEKELDPATMTVRAGTEHYDPAGEDDRAINVLDRETGTIWHTEWSPSAPQSSWWIAFDLGEATTVDGLRYLPRQGGNTTGRITGYQVLVSSSQSDWEGTTNTWQQVSSGSWGDNGDWKTASFPVVPARYVKLVATSGSHSYVSASEIRITAVHIPVEGVTLNRTEATLYTNATDPDRTVTLTATVTPADATNKKVVWDTSDPDIATVDKNGKVTAVGVDHTLSQATITATTEDGSFEASCVVTVRTRISGALNIVGPAKFGETLTAAINQIAPQMAGRYLSYQWKRDGATIDGETGRAYTLQEADIGHSITATVIASVPFEGTLTSAAVTPTLADGPAAPTGLSAADCTSAADNDGKIQGLASDKAYEISSDGVTWTAAVVTAAGAIENLTPGDYQIRLAATGTHAAGAASSAITIASYEAPPLFAITVDPALSGGAVTASKSRAQSGEVITLTVTPDEGYLLVEGSLALTGSDGEIPVSEGRFTMPAGAVTITARFEKKTYTLIHHLTNISCDMEGHDHTVSHGDKPTIHITPDPGCALPDVVTVTTTAGAEFFGYEYANGVITFFLGITEDLVVTGAAIPVDPSVEYTITYDLAGGTLSEENPATYTVATDDFTLQNPTRSGYTFAGWTGTGLEGAATTVTIIRGSYGDRSYTATWRASSGSSSRPGNTTTTTTPAGETVTTVTDARTGDTTVTVSAPDGSRAQIVNSGGTTTVSATISKKAVNAAGDGAVTLPAVGLTVENAPTVNLSLPKGVAHATVNIPVEALTPGAVAVRVAADGTEEIITQSLVENGALLLPVDDQNTTIRIVDNSKAFDDVTPQDWFADSVAHVASRELFQGTGENHFSPKEAMTRGMLVTVLFRYAGASEAGEAFFNDVEDGKFYSDAVRWAAENDVVSGVGDGSRFAPDQEISREQLAVMLYRFSGSPEVTDTSLEEFVDQDETSDWAKAAMAWAVSQGIIRGKDGSRLAPGDNASRSEVAAMLYRYTGASLLRK